jgi:hypothetical protein
VGPSVSCCCPASPRAQVVMTPKDDRCPFELLLCRQHRRKDQLQVGTSGLSAVAAVCLSAAAVLDREVSGMLYSLELRTETHAAKVVLHGPALGIGSESSAMCCGL